jgi:hypothetical protein
MNPQYMKNKEAETTSLQKKGMSKFLYVSVLNVDKRERKMSIIFFRGG